MVLPTLVGAGALASWTKNNDAPRIGGAGSVPTQTSTTALTQAAATQGFRCSDAGMLAGDVDAWLYFQGCESWVIDGVVPPTTVANLEQVPTTWAGPSTARVSFVNASSIDGAASSTALTRFGAGSSRSSPIKSPTSFVMYGDSVDEPTASAIAAELGVSLKASIDLNYLLGEEAQSSIFVVIGDDLAAQIAAPVTPSDTRPAMAVTGDPTRCWDPSEVQGHEPGYRFFTNCEPTQPGDAAGSAAGSLVTQPTSASECSATAATVLPGESPSILATKNSISLAELDAANVDTPGYSTFVDGIIVAIPCPAGQ